MSNRRGKLFVVSGPSGAGKSTVCREVSRRVALARSVSATTRAPRNGEEDGTDYAFLPRAEFVKRIEEGAFYEHAEVYGELYGTPRQPIEDGQAAGEDFLLDIDVQGARSVKRTCADAVLIFIGPPSMEKLKERLQGRGTESAGELELRLSEAALEMSSRDEYDYTVVNSNLEEAVAEVSRIVELEKRDGRIDRH